MSPTVTESRKTELSAVEERLKKFSDLELLEFLKVERGSMGLKSLYFHNRYILGYKDMTEQTHLPSCDWLQDWSNGRNKKLFITPRDTFKSSINVIGHILWLIVNNPRLKILIVGEEQDNAKAYLNAIKDHLATNETFKESYPHLYDEFEVNAWNTECVNFIEKKFKREQLIQKEHTIDIAGIGTTSVGMHYDYIFFVDPHSQKNVNTAQQLEKVIIYYKLLESIAKTGTGRIITEMTRWHWADLAQHIIDNEKGVCDTFIKSCYNDDGSLYFPERLSEDVLRQKQTSLGTYLFSLLYLSKPQSEKDKVFKPELATYYHHVPDGHILDKFLICDPSISEKENADDFALTCIGVDRSTKPYKLYIVDKMKVARKQPAQAVSDMIIMLNHHFRDQGTDKVGIEEVAFQRIYRFELERELSARGKSYRIISLKPGSRSKSARIMALQPFWEIGHILLRAGTEFKPSPDLDLLMQFEKFIAGRSAGKDDFLDTCAYMLDILEPQREGIQQQSNFQKKMQSINLHRGQTHLLRRFN